MHLRRTASLISKKRIFRHIVIDKKRESSESSLISQVSRIRFTKFRKRSTAKSTFYRDNEHVFNAKNQIKKFARQLSKIYINYVSAMYRYKNVTIVFQLVD